MLSLSGVFFKKKTNRGGGTVENICICIFNKVVLSKLGYQLEC